MTPPIPALCAQDLRKTFRDFWGRPTVEALKGLSFTLAPGEALGLLGPNGSGKSTAIRILLGLLRPDSGSVALFGHAPESPAAHALLGYLPEITHLHPFLTPRETLAYYGRLSGLSGKALRARIDDLLELTGLTHARDRRVGAFSKGMTRRVGLAQALINAPRVLILDEPTSGLDPIGTREVKELLLALKARGLAILTTSHLLPDVRDTCDRILILDRGTPLLQGPVAELHDSLESVFLRTLGCTVKPPECPEWLKVGEEVDSCSLRSQQTERR